MMQDGEESLPFWIQLLGHSESDETHLAATRRRLEELHRRQHDEQSRTFSFSSYDEVAGIVESLSPDWNSFLLHFDNYHYERIGQTRMSGPREFCMLVEYVFAISINPVSKSVVQKVIVPKLIPQLLASNGSNVGDLGASEFLRKHLPDYFSKMMTFVCSNPNARYEVVHYLLAYFSRAIKEMSEDSNDNFYFFNNFSRRLAGVQSDGNVFNDQNNLYSLMRTAIISNSIGAVRAIIGHNPKVLEMRDSSSLTPIHLIFSYRNEGNQKIKSMMLQLLLDEGRKHQMHLAMKKGHQTQNTFWMKLRESVWNSQPLRVRSNLLSAPIDLALYQLQKKYRHKSYSKEEHDDLWRCLSLCVQAIKEIDPSFTIIRYILSWRPTLYGFLAEAIDRLDIDLCEKDHQGRTPLLNAILQEPPRYHLIEQILKVADDREINLEPFDRYVDNDGNIVNNRHLLHAALETNIQVDLLWRVIYLNPDVLQARDPVTGLFPFLLTSSKNKHSVNDVYKMLRLDPSVILLCQNYGSKGSSQQLTSEVHAPVPVFIRKKMITVMAGLFCIFLQYYILQKWNENRQSNVIELR